MNPHLHTLILIPGSETRPTPPRVLPTADSLRPQRWTQPSSQWYEHPGEHPGECPRDRQDGAAVSTTLDHKVTHGDGGMSTSHSRDSGVQHGGYEWSTASYKSPGPYYSPEASQEMSASDVKTETDIGYTFEIVGDDASVIPAKLSHSSVQQPVASLAWSSTSADAAQSEAGSVSGRKIEGEEELQSNWDTTVHHQNLPHICSVCGRIFASTSALLDHTRTTHSHSGEEHGSTWDTTIQHQNLDLTRTTHTLQSDRQGQEKEQESAWDTPAQQQTLLSCSMCGRTFASKSGLLYHVRTHTGERPYKCVVCGNNFNRQHHLNVHLRTHTGEKPYSCEECGKTFRHRQHYKLHMQKAHDIVII
jgi:uncharacterized C2H2 Zn-finger protein